MPSIFPNNELQITEAYSELCQTFKMEYFSKKKKKRLILENTLSEMFDMVLNIPLDNLSCFDVVLRGILGIV